jgi:squalene cyclase
VLDKFAAADHFCAYQGELQPSLSVTAHAVHLLSLAGLEFDRSLDFVAERQGPDGRWLGDKWNGSWLYTTAHAIVALQHARTSAAIAPAVAALLLHQHDDGGWGMHESTPEETAHAILALRGLSSALTPAARRALERGEQWILASYRPFHRSQVTCWLGKEMYRPYRLARVIELAATLPRESHASMRAAA